MYPSDIRKKLATGKPVLSTSMPSFEPHIANATYNCKPDWVWIDTEHNPWGTESMGTLCVDGRKKGVAPVIRIPWNDPAYIKKAYDVGAVGVMIPQVDNTDEVKQAIHDGLLWELVENRLRTSPALMKVFGVLKREMDWISNFEPAYRYKTPIKTGGESDLRPIFSKLTNSFKNGDMIHPYFGKVPNHLSETYPFHPG